MMRYNGQRLVQAIVSRRICEFADLEAVAKSTKSARKIGPAPKEESAGREISLVYPG